MNGGKKIFDGSHLNILHPCGNVLNVAGILCDNCVKLRIRDYRKHAQKIRIFSFMGMNINTAQQFRPAQTS